MVLYYSCWIEAHRRFHLLFVILLLIPALLQCITLAQGRSSLEHSETPDRMGSLEEGRGEDIVVMEGSMIGSRPPRCAGICRDCGRCEAVQVPANPQRRTVGAALSATMNTRGEGSSNYKPLSWKCKCGDVIRNP